MTSRKKYTYARRTCQVLCVALVIFIIWGTRYPLGSFINARYIFHIDPLVMFTTAISERILLPGLLTASLTLLLTLLLGRFFCGWMCPLGAAMDFFSLIMKPLYRFLKIRTKESGPGRLRFTRYAVLFVIFAFATGGVQIAWIIDPVTIFFRAFSMNIHPFLVKNIDAAFISLLRMTDFNTSIEMAHITLRNSFLSASSPRFPHSGVILAVFLASILTVAIKRRWWCRYLCPLGALLSLAARFSPFTRVVRSCRDGCSLCRHSCRTGAIRQDNTYLREECILCMDCISFCVEQDSTFTFRKYTEKADRHGPDSITRSSFLRMIFLFLIPGTGIQAFGNTGTPPARPSRKRIRPPGSLPEHEFIQQCIRCGNCMKVCPTNVLQPSAFEQGASGLWTPFLDTGIGYCEYNCFLCSQVCPTDAIKKLTLKQKQREIIGLAVIDRELCLPWAKQENCIVCEEHCPTEEKAIVIREKRLRGGNILRLPVIDPGLCIGCAACEFKCPTEPRRAVTIKIIETS